MILTSDPHNIEERYRFVPDPCIASAVRVFLSARLLVMDDIFQLIWKVVDDFFGVVVSKPRESQFWLQYHGCPMSVPRVSLAVGRGSR